MSLNEQNSGLFSWLKSFIDLSSSNNDDGEMHSDNDLSNNENCENDNNDNNNKNYESDNNTNNNNNNNNNTNNVLSTSVLDLTSESTVAPESTVVHVAPVSTHVIDLTLDEYKINPLLPLLPFTYNPNLKQILTFHGKFQSINIHPEEYDYGWSIVMVNDLDYQFLKYLQTLKDMFISVPSVLADINNELVESIPVPFDEFMECIDSLSSNDPRYSVINGFLKFNNTYQYYGLNCPIDWWFDNIYSTDGKVHNDIQELHNQVHLHSVNL